MCNRNARARHRTHPGRVARPAVARAHAQVLAAHARLEALLATRDVLRVARHVGHAEAVAADALLLDEVGARGTLALVARVATYSKGTTGEPGISTRSGSNNMALPLLLRARESNIIRNDWFEGSSEVGHKKWHCNTVRTWLSRRSASMEIKRRILLRKRCRVCFVK